MPNHPELPEDQYGSSADEMYAAASQLLGRHDATSMTLTTRVQGIRTVEEATILAAAEANHQARRPVIAALNQRRMELAGGHKV